MIGVTYSESNQLGGGLRDPGDGGLTTFGRQAVTRMNRLGMAIDVSHTGDVTAMQTCEVSTAPVFLSHSGARALFARDEDEGGRPAEGGRRHGRRDRDRGVAEHDDRCRAAALDSRR